ncbi:type VI secretion system tip protein TssI/VgrG [Variovorax sp. J22R133]|uniref:type VI secretion system Vgr family protein n=1 Tax=Variovorax brevis TaxID=3053503 RepID=UPI002578EA80|nr:type VI secretion system Vgr family protein [Variovorax sp. J22R133]MDM0111190.1 type VI secretion system tip protein TssI/VgrG [Variovorax sp. J22R133]
MLNLSHTLRVASPAIPLFLGQPALHPVRICGREGVNSLFEYELLLKTPDALNLGASGAADFDLDQFIGREIACTIDLDGAGEFLPGAVGASVDRIGAGVRQINALITDAQLWGEEGRHIQYKLTLRPWLHLATLTTDCKIFQNKTVSEIFDELLADYPFSVEKRLYETYPVRDYQCQFNESDFAFFERLCQEWGISFHFEHSDDKHRLVLSDAMGAYKPNDSAAYQIVEYHAPGWKIDAEYIHTFTPHNHLTSGRYATRDYDYTRPKSDLAVGSRDPRPTGQADQEIYEWHASQTGSAGSHYAQPRAGATGSNEPAAEGGQLALLRMQALRSHGSRAQASGNLRGMVPGCTFRLAKHPRHRANAEYLILDTRLLIEDVARDSQHLDARTERRQQWRVQVDLTAHPVAQPLRPELTRSKPRTGGPQPALVVGPEGQNVWTDDLGRIKVQFPWDRIGQKNQHSTCWLRVSSPWAGNQLGGVHIPRIGQEVIVDFYGGDPDLPICTGRVHNQMNLPPWSLPGQHALSGFRSRELLPDSGNASGGRSNHLVMDDTAERIQVQLKSDHQHSQLSLGHIARIDGNRGRADLRGEGFELRTDGHGVLRAQDGLLISTEGRAAASGYIKAMDEAKRRLAKAHEQHEQMAELAQKFEAQQSGKEQSDVANGIAAQNADISGDCKPDVQAGVFPELAKPHLVLASPAGIETSTRQSTHIASDEHNAFTSGGHTSLVVGRGLFASVKDAIKLFAHKAGMKLVAASGDIDIKALNDSIHVLAKLNINQTAERITISAGKELILQGGRSFSRYADEGIVHGTPGFHREQAATHVLEGPQSRSIAANGWPDAQFNEQFIVKTPEGKPVSRMRYRIKRDDGAVIEGVTGADGIVPMQKGTDPAQLTIELLGIQE